MGMEKAAPHVWPICHEAGSLCPGPMVGGRSAKLLQTQTQGGLKRPTPGYMTARLRWQWRTLPLAGPASTRSLMLPLWYP